MGQFPLSPRNIDIPYPRRGAAGGDSRYPDWHTIYTDNAAWVYRMLFPYVGNQPDAEDLTAEVFLRAFKPLRVPAKIAEVRGYLRVSVGNAKVLQHRALRRAAALITTRNPSPYL